MQTPKTGRLFCFGCSFTAYAWPTWADIISMSSDFSEYQNWGNPGAGNQYISLAVSECIGRYQINSNDTVLIMWSSVMREDRYINVPEHKGWLIEGNIYARMRPDLYTDHFMEKLVDVRGFYIRDLGYINLVAKTLQGIGCKFAFMSMNGIDNPIETLGSLGTDQNEDISDLLLIYKDVINLIKPSVCDVIYGGDFHNCKREKDGYGDFHPYPLEHLRYLKTVLPEYKFTEQQVQLISEWDQRALSGEVNFTERHSPDGRT